MNLRTRVAAMLMLGLVSAQVACAEPAKNVQHEISFLLGFVAGSGCAFFRNGHWYDAKEAETHLRDKYNYLVALGRIGSSEDFIDKAATNSSFSGQAYEVRCHGSPAIQSSQWLRDELIRIRVSK